MFEFTGKVAAITGASGISIGREIAERFYRAGARIAICSRSQERVSASAREIAGERERDIYAVAANVSEVEDIYAFVDGAIARFGRLDVLVNNAGIEIRKPSLEITREDWRRVADTNLRGYFFAAQRAAKYMTRNGGGVIVNIGSVNAVTVVVGQTVYAATKAGISQMTKSLAREWGPSNIRVNCVAPGSVPTLINREVYKDPQVERAMCDKIPLGRRGSTREIADAALFLASDYASYITGQTLFVDGGLTLVHG